MTTLKERLHRWLFPEIEKELRFRAAYIEELESYVQFIVDCYSGEDGGFSFPDGLFWPATQRRRRVSGGDKDSSLWRSLNKRYPWGVFAEDRPMTWEEPTQ